jgi:methylase of polypeptide subunit release factors
MDTDMPHSATDVLVLLGRWLQSRNYRFTTPTPATHARVNARAGNEQAKDLRGIFGWSRPFSDELLPVNLLDALRNAELLETRPDGLLSSRVRYSSIDDHLFAHSAFPTAQPDAVFFGPDTYRFVGLIEQVLQRQPLVAGAARILDMGCGAGPGGIVAARLAAASSPDLMLADINPAALQHARANATLAALQGVELVEGDLFNAVAGQFDFIVANPPYLNDSAQRVYRHGGGEWGEGLSERIVREGLPRLAPGGRLVLYTGAAIVHETDPLLEALRPHLQDLGWAWTYWELDPDVFGEELAEPAYTGAERIAAVALVVQRPRRA